MRALRRVRWGLFVVGMIGGAVLTVLCLVGRLRGWDTLGLGRALGILLGVLVLLSWPPTRAPVQPRPRGAAVALGRAVIGLGWLARSVLVGYVAYRVAGQVDTATFQPALAVAAGAFWVLDLTYRAGLALARFPRGRRGSRAAAVLRSLATLAANVLVAGFANPLSTAAAIVTLWIPERAYHLVMGWTGTGWVAVPVAVLVAGVWWLLLAVVGFALRWVLNRLLGDGNAVGEWIDDSLPCRVSTDGGSSTPPMPDPPTPSGYIGYH